MPGRRELRRDAVARLSAAGVEAPESEADGLLSLALGGMDRSRLFLLTDLSDEEAEHFEGLLRRRENREPFQHLAGMAFFRHAALEIGPGAFVPRPETELLAGWAIDVATALEAPVVVDLCTGSGAIARSIADEVPHARVHAVELSPEAHQWAAINLHGTGVDLRLGDMSDAFTDLDGQVDVVVCNPPY
ncbi:MAG: peptide chain release factor N(5)-glutamine methyltransferase, partial [Myxococcales bacterium]